MTTTKVQPERERESPPLKTLSFEVSVPVPFDLAMMVRSHGWVMLAPWKWDGATLSRTERLKGAAGLLSVTQSGSRSATIEWRPQDASADLSAEVVAPIVSRWLSWDWDHRPFVALAETIDRAVADLVKNGGGRFLRGSTFYEDFVKTVCTINTTWPLTQRMVTAIVKFIGGEKFPSPTDILVYGEPLLKSECRLGFRSSTIIRATEMMLADGLMDTHGHVRPEDATYEYLISLHGIGPYAAAHCRVLLHDFSRLPIDSEVTAHLVNELKLERSAFSDYFASWREYRFLGYKLRRIAGNVNWIGD